VRRFFREKPRIRISALGHFFDARALLVEDYLPPDDYYARVPSFQLARKIASGSMRHNRTIQPFR
jgi:hypothetical protein